MWFSRLGEKRDTLKAASEVLLGDEAERADGEAAFEKWSQAQRVRKTERAYPLGCTVQQPRRIDAPSASFKLEPDAVLDQHQEAIKSFVQVRSIMAGVSQLLNFTQAGADLAISGWEAEAPDEIKEVQRNHSDAVNCPRVGCDGNYMFPAFQLNIAKERSNPST